VEGQVPMPDCQCETVEEKRLRRIPS